MEHKMKLVNFAFEKIKNKEKDIELRLNDEKRKLINIGDTIVFTNINTNEELEVLVTNLYKYNSFKELFSKFDNNRFGLKEDEDYTVMDNFYSREEQEKYGVVGIEIKPVKL